MTISTTTSTLGDHKDPCNNNSTRVEVAPPLLTKLNLVLTNTVIDKCPWIEDPEAIAQQTVGEICYPLVGGDIDKKLLKTRLYRRLIQNVERDHNRRSKEREAGAAWSADHSRTVAEASDPQKALDRKLIRQAVEDTLSSIPPFDADVFLLHVYDARSYRELAEAYGTSEAAVRSAYRRAVRHLRHSTSLRKIAGS